MTPRYAKFAAVDLVVILLRPLESLPAIAVGTQKCKALVGWQVDALLGVAGNAQKKKDLLRASRSSCLVSEHNPAKMLIPEP